MRKYLKKYKKTMKIFFVYALNIFLMNFKVIQVYADGDPLTVVNNLSTFVFSLIRAIGMIILGFGIVQLGLSLKSHDPSQRANGFLTVAGGIVITFAKEILNTIIKHTKNNKTLTLSLQDRKNNSYDLKDIEYSLTDIINCINRFTDDSYIKKSQIEEYKNKINSEELTLFDLDPQYVKICFSPSELENIAKLNSQNLQYVSTILQWNKDKILNNIKFQKNCPVELLKDFMTKKIIYPNDIISLYKDNKGSYLYVFDNESIKGFNDKRYGIVVNN